MSGTGELSSRNGSSSYFKENLSGRAPQMDQQELFKSVNSGINFDKYEDIDVQFSGDNAPKPITSFTDLKLHIEVEENIIRSGYTKPTPVQKYSIPTLLGGRDLMSCAQTGSGKTAAFLVPIINHILVRGSQAIKQKTLSGTGRYTYYPAALVLAPTRELAMQIHKEALKFSNDTGLEPAMLHYLFLSVGRVGSTSENIHQSLQWVDKFEKRKALVQILENEGDKNLVLVFLQTKRGCDELVYFLDRQGIRAVTIHGDLKQYERERNLQSFKTGSRNVLIATAVAARGLDIPNVMHVVNFDLPTDIDEYVHRIGRTGRCGNLGKATSFYNSENYNLQQDLLKIFSERKYEIPDFLVNGGGAGSYGSSARRFGGSDSRRSDTYSSFKSPNSSGNGGSFGRSSGFGANFNSRPSGDSQGFGRSSGSNFGAGMSQASKGTGFGATSSTSGSGFGQRSGGFSATPKSSGFVAAAPSNGGFGQRSNGGFGSDSPSNGSGFGQRSNGGFGSSSNGSSGFGQKSNAGFGQRSTGSGFGSSNKGFGNGGF